MEEQFDCVVDNGRIIEQKNIGWICPKCGASVSPTLTVCPLCGGGKTDESLSPGESIICG